MMQYLRTSIVFLIPLAFIGSTMITSAATTLENPLNPSFSSIPNFIAGALKVMVMIALPIISLFIVWSGFLFVSAQGNEGKLSEAKNNLLYVVIGSVLILGAWVIATLIGGTVTQLTNG